MIVRELKLQDAKPAATPGSKEVKAKKEQNGGEGESTDGEDEDDDDDVDMIKEDATKYRGLLARLN